MRVDLAGQPAYTIAYCILDAGETLSCEPGAMVALSGGISVRTQLPGGFVSAAMRKAFADEKFFAAAYAAEVHGAWVAIAPRYPGDVAVLEVRPGAELAITSGSLLAHTGAVELDVRFAGVREFLLKEGVTVVAATGDGQVLIGSYGALQCVTLGDGETLVVDTGHLVAWDRDLELRIGPLSGVVSSALTGEGLVGQFTGPGRVWVQTRAEQQLRSWLFPGRDSNTGN